MIKKIKIHDQIEHVVEISGLSHDGRGIAQCLAKKTFVFGALANEKVSCKILKKRSSYHEAYTTKILQAASNRSTPICEHFGICGGCNLQHMDSRTQLELKQETLLNHLKHFGNIENVDLLPPLQAATQGYRHKARLGVRFVYKKNKLLLGFREKESRYLADLQSCKVLHPRVGENFANIAKCIDSLSLKEKIPQIEIAIGDTEVALIIRHLDPMGIADKEKLIEFGMQHDYHIYLQPNLPAAIEQICPNQTSRLSYALPAYQLTYSFHPLDFTQINLPLNRVMVEQAIRLLELKPSDRVLDLFCGLGNFTLPIARFAKEVVGIEGNQDMVLRGYENAASNAISNASFFAANLMKNISHEPWARAYDKVLLDPPRTGAKDIITQFKLFDPKRIVYVSCNTATLARDAHILVHDLGYKLSQAGIMNMFPHTAHIEAMAVFIKNEGE